MSGIFNFLARTYDSDFRVTSLNVNGVNAIPLAYDNDGLLTGAGSLSITRSAQTGFVTGATLGGTSTAYTYNTFGELASERHTGAGTTFYDVAYTRDKLGRITSRIETVGGVATTYGYVYDTAGRLVQVSKNGAAIAAYAYDQNGNRIGKTDSIGTAAGTYDAQDRLLTYGANSYAYTANGELLTKTNASGTTSYNYDVLGNLRSAALPDGTLVEYVIDGANRRVGKKINGVLTQSFLYANQLNPIAELDGAGNVVATFIYGTKSNVPDYVVKNGVTYRIISNHLGSPVMVVDATTGVVAQQISYDEFGVVLTDTNPGFTPFGFGGGLYDNQTKFVRFGARDYDPDSGRWTAKDPIDFAGGDVNLYGYVFNDPINWIDSLGMGAHPVYAANNGTVVSVKYSARGGWQFIIKTSEGGYDIYAHMDPNSAPSVGRKVCKGDYIGDYADPTNGNSTGPHVHYQHNNSQNVPTDPGNVNVLGGGGVVTLPYGATDSSHPSGHTGIDFAYPTAQ